MSRKAVAAGLLTALLAFAVLAYRAATVTMDPAAAAATFTPAFRGDSSGPEAMLNAHDGQAFGSLALDPLLSHPERWTDGRVEMGYRASRPVLGWAVLLTSFGSKSAAAWSLLAWAAIGTGLLAAAAAVLAHRWGRQGDWVPLLLLLPGVGIQLVFGGLSDSLAAGLALLGLAWWLDGKDRWAVAALCVAALTKESTLLVPLALLLASERRRALRLVLPLAAYLGWAGVVWLRLGVWVTDARPDALGVPPANLGTAIARWGAVEVVCAVSVVVLMAVAWRRAPAPEIRWLVGLSVLFTLTLSPIVLRSWDFTRPLLPVTVVGACLLATRRHEPVAAPAYLPARAGR